MELPQYQPKVLESSWPGSEKNSSGCEVIFQESPAGDHAANRAIENAVKHQRSSASSSSRHA
eukprot:1211609-Pyramimonas_sp.AAC.1